MPRKKADTVELDNSPDARLQRIREALNPRDGEYKTLLVGDVKWLVADYAKLRYRVGKLVEAFNGDE